MRYRRAFRRRGGEEHATQPRRLVVLVGPEQSLAESAQGAGERSELVREQDVGTQPVPDFIPSLDDG